jgi:hypothetical protein
MSRDHVDISLAANFTLNSPEHAALTTIMMKYSCQDVSISKVNGTSYVKPGIYKLKFVIGYVNKHGADMPVYHESIIKVSTVGGTKFFTQINDLPITEISDPLHFASMAIQYVTISKYSNRHEKISSKINNGDEIVFNVKDGRQFASSTRFKYIPFEGISLMISDHNEVIRYTSPNFTSIDQCLKFFN